MKQNLIKTMKFLSLTALLLCLSVGFAHAFTTTPQIGLPSIGGKTDSTKPGITIPTIPNSPTTPTTPTEEITSPATPETPSTSTSPTDTDNNDSETSEEKEWNVSSVNALIGNTDIVSDPSTSQKYKLYGRCRGTEPGNHGYSTGVDENLVTSQRENDFYNSLIRSSCPAPDETECCFYYYDEDAEPNDCAPPEIVLNKYLDDCWQCRFFKTIFNAINSLSTKTYMSLSEDCIGLLGVCLGLWLLIHVGRYIGSLKEQKESEFIDAMMGMFLKATIAAALLWQSAAALSSILISPLIVMTAEMNIAILESFARDESLATGDTENTIKQAVESKEKIRQEIQSALAWVNTQLEGAQGGDLSAFKTWYAEYLDYNKLTATYDSFDVGAKVSFTSGSQSGQTGVKRYVDCIKDSDVELMQPKSYGYGTVTNSGYKGSLIGFCRQEVLEQLQAMQAKLSQMLPLLDTQIANIYLQNGGYSSVPQECRDMENEPTSEEVRAPHFRYLTISTSADGASMMLNSQISSALQCIIRSLHNQVTFGTAMGSWFMCRSWTAADVLGAKIPDLRILFIGVCIWVVCFILSLVFLFKLIDAVFRLGVLLVLLPLLIVAWVFPATVEFTKKGFNMLLHVLMMFIVLGIVMALSILLVEIAFDDEYANDAGTVLAPMESIIDTKNQTQQEIASQPSVDAIRKNLKCNTVSNINDGKNCTYWTDSDGNINGLDEAGTAVVLWSAPVEDTTATDTAQNANEDDDNLEALPAYVQYKKNPGRSGTSLRSAFTNADLTLLQNETDFSFLNFIIACICIVFAIKITSLVDKLASEFSSVSFGTDIGDKLAMVGSQVSANAAQGALTLASIGVAGGYHAMSGGKESSSSSSSSAAPHNTFNASNPHPIPTPPPISHGTGSGAYTPVNANMSSKFAANFLGFSPADFNRTGLDLQMAREAYSNPAAKTALSGNSQAMRFYNEGDKGLDALERAYRHARTVRDINSGTDFSSMTESQRRTFINIAPMDGAALSAKTDSEYTTFKDKLTLVEKVRLGTADTTEVKDTYTKAQTDSELKNLLTMNEENFQNQEKYTAAEDTRRGV